MGTIISYMAGECPSDFLEEYIFKTILSEQPCVLWSICKNFRK